MIRAALYARFSSNNQREESITAQFRDSIAYCKKKGYIIVRKYTDEAKSGTTTDGRDQYLQMLTDSKADLFDVIIFHKIDRNARNEYDYYTTKHLLQQTGIRYEYSKQDIDSNTPEGQMMESVMVGMAAYYSRNLANEIKKGLRENAYEGKSTGGRPPYGYTTDKEKHIIINKEEAPAIRLIFDMYKSGVGYHDICSRIYESGYRNRKGKAFQKTALYEILRNPKYKGTLIIGRAYKKENKRNSHKLNPDAQIFDNVIPAIIDKNTFEAVQMKLNKNKMSPAANKAKTLYALSGLVFCGECGAPMCAHVGGKKGFPVHYYRCNNARLIGPKACHNRSIRQEYIEADVLAKIKSLFLSPNARKHITELIVGNLERNPPKNYHDILKHFNKQYEVEKRKLDHLYDLVESGTADQYDLSRMQDVKQELNNLKRQIQDAKDHLTVGELTHEKIDEMISIVQKMLKEKQDPRMMKALFYLVVHKVEIYKDEIVVYLMVSQEGFEPPTHCLEGSCSIQLSY